MLEDQTSNYAILNINGKNFIEKSTITYIFKKTFSSELLTLCYQLFGEKI